MDHAAPILDYGLAQEARLPLARRLAGLVLYSPLVAVPFLPFAYQVSPWDAVQELFNFPFFELVDDELALLGAPFFLTIVLTYFKTRQWFMRLTRIELRLMQLLAALIVGGEIWIGIGFGQNVDLFDSYEGSVLVGYVCMLAITVGFGVMQPLRRVPLEKQVQTLLALSFLSNAGLCLSCFYWTADVGYYTTIYSCVVIVGGLLWTFARRNPAG